MQDYKFELLLRRLRSDELRTLGKRLKVANAGRAAKDDLIEDIINAAHVVLRADVVDEVYDMLDNGKRRPKRRRGACPASRCLLEALDAVATAPSGESCGGGESGSGGESGNGGESPGAEMIRVPEAMRAPAACKYVTSSPRLGHMEHTPCVIGASI